MNGLLAELLPYAVSGVVAAVVSWVTMRIDVKYLRRDLDGLRFRVHAENNPNSLVNAVQDHETRITLLERFEERREEG